MKRIGVLEISSVLHDKNHIAKVRDELIFALKNSLDVEIEIKDINNFYDSDLSLILVESGGSENTFLSLENKLNEPFYFLTINENNSLAASLEIFSYLKINNKKGQIIHGSIDEVINQIKELLNKNG